MRRFWSFPIAQPVMPALGRRRFTQRRQDHGEAAGFGLRVGSVEFRCDSPLGAELASNRPGIRGISG